MGVGSVNNGRPAAKAATVTAPVARPQSQMKLRTVLQAVRINFTAYPAFDMGLLERVMVPMRVADALHTLHSSGITGIQASPVVDADILLHVFSDPSLPGLQRNGNATALLDGTKVAAQIKAQNKMGPLAPKLLELQEQARIAYSDPTVIAADLKALLARPLDAVSTEMPALLRRVETVDSKLRKPIVEAARSALRENMRQAVARLEEKKTDAENKKEGEKLNPLFDLFAALKLWRLTEKLLDELIGQDKLGFIDFVDGVLAERVSAQEQAHFLTLVGDFNRRIGEPGAAKAYYTRAVALDPANKSARHALRACLQELAASRPKDEDPLALSREFDKMFDAFCREREIALNLLLRRLAQQEEKVALPPELLALGKVLVGTPKAWDAASHPLSRFDVARLRAHPVPKASQRDPAEIAQSVKKELLDLGEKGAALAAWAEKQDINKLEKILEDKFEHVSGLIEANAGYILLLALRQKFKAANNDFALLCDHLMHESIIRDCFIRRLAFGSKVATPDFLLIFIALDDEGFIFPDRIDALKKAMFDPTNPNRHFCAFIFHHLIGRPANELVNSTKERDAEKAIRVAREIADADSAEAGKRVLCIALSNAALLEFNRGKIDEGLKHLEEAETLGLKIPLVMRARCVYFDKTGKPEEAAKCAEESLAFAPRDEREHLAEIYGAFYLDYANVDADKGKVDFGWLRRSKEMFTRAHEINPDKIRSVYYCGLLSFFMKDYAEGIKWAKKMLSIAEKGEAKRFVMLADTATEALRDEEARPYFAELKKVAAALDALVIDALNNRESFSEGETVVVNYARMLFQMGENEKAEALLNLARRNFSPLSTPHNFARFSLAELYLRTEKYREAHAILEKLTKLEGNFDEAVGGGIFKEKVPLQGAVFNLYGAVCLELAEEEEEPEKTAHYDRALAAFERAKELGFPAALAEQQKGLVWSDRGEEEKAFVAWRAIVKADPTMILPQLNICFKLHALGRKQELDGEEAALLTMIVRMMRAKDQALEDVTVYSALAKYYEVTKSPQMLHLFRLLQEKDEYRLLAEQTGVLKN